ncbi:hypothetical protein V5O48_010604, partial [Marasmius crinis-equi]
SGTATTIPSVPLSLAHSYAREFSVIGLLVNCHLPRSKGLKNGNCDHTPESSKKTPTDLCNLVPAGTLELHLSDLSYPPKREVCDHRHLEDGWHYFDVENLKGLVSEADLIEALAFLIDKSFVSASYNYVDEYTVVVRIYLIPYDLPGMRGQLSRKMRNPQVLSRGKYSMSSILPWIRQDPQSWEGMASSLEAKHLIDTEVDRRTLPEIYSDLPSPKPNTTSSVAERLLHLDDDLAGLGLFSTLHRYQRRSVATMIEYESETRRIPDPLYLPLIDMNGKTFYFQPGTTEVLLTVSEVSARGGVLCEELGTGKTIMTLALVLSNLKELSTPESVVGQQPAILTPLSLRHFPDVHLNLGHDTRMGSRRTKNADVLTFPTFREILIDKHCRDPLYSVPNTSALSGQQRLAKRRNIEDMVEQLPFAYLERTPFNAPFYISDLEDPTDNRRSGRSPVKPVVRALFLTSATLIVVPANLISQWEREIHKHCEDVLRVLTIRSHKDLPHARKLATEWDIILITYRAFADGDTKSNVRLDPYRPCRCAEFPDLRIPHCKCKRPEISPLLQVRWKRLVIDEGHVSASLATRLTPFSKVVSVQSRWIVTGTPTTNLLGLSFGNQSVKNDSSPNAEGLEMTSDETFASDTADDDFPMADTSSDELLYPPEPRIWTGEDQRDINKLTTMLTHFVGVKFLGDHRLVQDNIRDPLFNTNGPRPGAIKVLTQLMSFTMIRHRAEDVERDVVLPKLEHESIFLDLDPYAMKSYNALQASIAINAIDSERQDEDYLFHKKNTEHLQLLVENMSQILFWSVDETLYNVHDMHHSADAVLERAMKRDVTEADRKLAKEAIIHVKTVFEDELWRRIQSHEDIPYRVRDVGRAVFQNWSRLDKSDADGHQLMHPDRLIQLREWAIKHPFKTEEVLTELGRHNAEVDAEQRRWHKQSERRRSSKRAGAAPKDNNETKAADAAKQGASGEALREMQKELQASLERLAMAEEEGDDVTVAIAEEDDESLALASRNAQINARDRGLLANPAVIPIQVGSSCSSKLNYVIQDVLQHSKDEKFLIFSDSELTLAHVAEGLQLAQVKFLRFSTQIKQRVREEMVLTFETSNLYRVFLMELKHGARGLNLVTASRVIFCEPVWQADVESQAIKRAHRIGQTRPVHVKTLAIRKTAEEEMLQWRGAHSKQEDGKAAKVPLEQVEIRDFIANPKFLYPNSNSAASNVSLDFPLLPSARAPNQPSSPSTVKKTTIRILPPRSTPEKRKVGLTFLEPVSFPKKKRKVIAFAE